MSGINYVNGNGSSNMNDAMPALITNPDDSRLKNSGSNSNPNNRKLR